MGWEVTLAAGWGVAAASGLVLGALLGFFVAFPKRVVALVMAFGAGVLISAVAFDLVDEAYRSSGMVPVALAFIAGGATFTAGDLALRRFGAKHRKRSERQPSEGEHHGSGLSIALGSLMDGLPESVVIGIGVASGAALGVTTVAAIFVSNVAESLSSSAGMRTAHRTAGYVFGVWGGIALLSGLAAAGAAAVGEASAAVDASTTSFAAGAILAMLADTMRPEAFEGAHAAAGLTTAAGFLAAFAAGHLLA